MFKSEKDFVNTFNQKSFAELSLKAKQIVLYIFKRKINNGKMIYCFKLYSRVKSDVAIRIGNEKIFISLKTGNNDSVHQESLSLFISFLRSMGM